MITKGEGIMGMFDSIYVKCPNCGTKEEFQTKGGDCLLRCYNLKDAPSDVLADVNRHSPYTCRKCGTQFAVDIKNRISIEYNND